MIMLIFAFVAVFVGAFIINNTFSITVAQRTREHGDAACDRRLRAPGQALGARSRRVAVGVFASAIGLAAGVGCGIGSAAC